MQSQLKFENKTLILPSLSYGLCDSLALDLIIYNFKFQKVTNLDFKNLYPVVFNLEEISGDVAMPCEIYQKDKYVILQIRSAIAPGGTKTFMKQLEDFINSHSFDQVICLSSVNTTSLIHSNLNPQTSNLVYHTNSDEIAKRVSTLSKPIEKVSNLLGKYQDDIEKNATQGINRKVRRLGVFDKLPLVIFYGLTSNNVDINASTNLATNLMEYLGLTLNEKILYPQYFKRFFE